MKKKIAVFGNGWSYDYVTDLINGMEQCAKLHRIDLYLFFHYTSIGNNEKECIAEQAIYHLPDLHEFDGVIIIGNVLSEDEIHALKQLITDVHIPTVSIGYPISGIPSILIDNVSGMKELVEHLFEVHHISNPMFVSGPKNHPDSILRQNAFLEVCHKYGCNVTDDFIIESNWTEEYGGKLLRKYFRAGKPKPDAIICANDNMAFGVYNALLDMNYRIPEDILVTGFDSIEDCLFVQPILSSVSCNWQQMGNDALSLLLDQIKGKMCAIETIIISKADIRQSCGCAYHPDKATASRIRHRSPHRQKTAQILHDMHFRRIYACIREAQDETCLHHSLKYYYNNSNAIEANNIMICLQPDFATNPALDSQILSKQPNIIYGKYDGIDYFKPATDIFPLLEKLSNTENQTNTLLFLPLQTSGTLYGYGVFKWDSLFFTDYYLYTWSRHFVQSLELVRHQIQIHSLNETLKELSYKDALTGVYNRNGCDELTLKLLNDYQTKQQNCAIIMADLDKMKLINDQYGHTQGDLALQLLAHSLIQTCPSTYIISRYGGDEFLIVGPCDQPSDLQQLMDDIESTLANKIIKAKLPYQLTTSIGGFFKPYQDDLTLEQCIEKADQSLYQMKTEHHKLYHPI